MLKDFLFPEQASRRSSLGRMVNQSTVLLMASIGALILLLALLILFHQNSNATKGYLLRNLEKERSHLLLEQEVLNMQVAKAQAMEKIENDRQVQTMIPVKKPIYTKNKTPEPVESTQ
ncbi:MAG: hypothetical protein HOG89_05640 [Candidatus Peribacter sp.]|jgi:hypothetical protein|nr:hypothetical protein [Candidatus Peribacter sp.]MBT4392432.1 hypothetical protein [Candidatus Peribacter sp.]MBT4601238.1 hypothetical protein [Candidatus Peribacter sp.]MBT5149287.1 hypothetical protein [Candidatus Peribacter sp.]MBT5637111.1 hypothetical protein [Candidatus Peribacter sp.]